MQEMSRQLFSLRKALLRLIALVIFIPGLLLSYGLFTAGTPAHAKSLTTHISPQGQVTVSSAVKHDVSPPLRSIKPVHTKTVQRHPLFKLPPLRQGLPNGLHDHVQNTPAPATIPSPTYNFGGVGNGFTGPQGTFTVNAAPPDTNGAVGPQDYVQTVNTDFAVFNKDPNRGAVGSVRYGPVQINTLWSGFGGNCQADNDGDPVVVYDSIANRWLISQFAVTNPNPNYYQCVAVSTGSDPTGTYNRYAFSYTNFPDYPKIGLWPDAYYATFNLFDSTGTTFLGAQVCAFDRTSMLSGANATQQCYTTSTNYAALLPSTLEGSTLPPTGAPNYLVALDTTTSLGLWKFHVDFTNPGNSTFTGPTSIPVASYAEACGGSTCIPQSGTTNQLDSLADRVMYRLEYRNFGSYESLVVDHAITAGSSVGMRWYEIRSPGGTPTINQSGTYAPDANYRWMGSIAQDQSADMAMGFSVSSSSMHPGISYTGRLSTDAPGTMGQGEASMIVGSGSQTGGLTRWGDYSSMSVDPADDCTFWYTNEYIPSNGSFNWETQIGAFKFSSCGSSGSNDFSISANPTSLSITQGSNGTSTISTAVTKGSAGTINLTAAVSPSSPTASLNPTSVTAGNSSTLTVSVGSSVPTGTYTVTVTGTEGSAVHNTTVTITVTAPVSNDFSISANPTSLSIAQGSNGTSTISTAVTKGSAGTINLTSNVSPSGPTAALNPTSVTAGNSSTLTVSVGSSVPTGTYTVTVTGTEGSAVHNTTVTVTVTSSGGIQTQLLANNGFENGQSPWRESSSGGYQIIDPTNPHTGNYSAYLCGYNYCKDQIWQTVTLPSTTTKVVLSYWLYIDTNESGNTCYDYFYARIRTSSGGTITTPQTQCNVNVMGWTQFTFDVTSALSNYHGKQVQVYFEGTTDPSLPTDFFVDDVTFTATHS
ncbi:MAG: COG1470 family protein [Ktedonobacteraceae bacterium]